MDAASVADYLTGRYSGVIPLSAWGETSFFFNPNGLLPRGIYFATIKDRDGENDRASNLDRTGIFRLNLGIGKTAYLALFDTQPARPAAGGVVDTGHDFTALDQITPHPVYGWMSWISVLNPSSSRMAELEPLLDSAHRLAVEKHRRRVAKPA